MTPDSAPHSHDAVTRARAAARRQAPGLSGALPLFVALGLALVLVTIIILLDYHLDQDPHRIFKVAVGLAAFGAILLMPRFGLLVLPVVTPFLPWLPPTPVPGLNVLNLLLFAIFGTFAVNRVLTRRELVPSNHLGRALGLILLIGALSIVRGAAFPTGFGFDAGNAAITLFRAGTTFATYFIAMSMARGPGDRKRVFWAVVAGLLAESLVTMAYGRNGRGMRAIGSIGQSNDLGAFLALFAVPAFAGFFGVRNWFGKLVAIGTFGLASFGIILSLSRGSMVALLAGVVLVAWMSSRWAVLVLAVALALSPVWAPDYLKARVMSSSVEVEGSDEVTVDMAAEARLQTWQTIMTVVQEHPFDGVGFTGLGYILPEVGEGLGLEEVKESAHNTWLRMLSELGVFGLAVFAWIMWKCFALGLEGVRRARTAFDRSLGVGVCGATVALAVNCAFGDRFFDVVVASSFWMLLALVEDSIREAKDAGRAAAEAAA